MVVIVAVVVVVILVMIVTHESWTVRDKIYKIHITE